MGQAISQLPGGGMINAGLSLWYGTPGGPRLSDTAITSSTYGKPIMMGWGTMRVAGQLIYGTALQKHDHFAGKGGMIGTTYSYSWSGAIAICATDQTGPIGDVLKIWADGVIVFDKTGQTLGTNVPGAGGGKGGGGHSKWANAFNKLGNFRLYTGTQDQMPDTVLETLYGVGNVNANRGMAYIVMDNINLNNYGNRIPNFTFEVCFNQTDVNQGSFFFTFDNSKVGTPSQLSATIDSVRQRAYFFCEGNASNSGIHVFDLRTGIEIMSADYAQLFPGSSVRYIRADGACVGVDGYLYLTSDEANTSPIIKIDPDALTEVDHFGVASAGLTDGPSGFVVSDFMVPLYLSGVSALLCASEFGDIGLMSTNGLQGMGFISAFKVPEGFGFVAGGEQVTTDHAQAFIVGCPLSLGGGSPDPISLYRVDMTIGGMTSTKVGSLLPSDVNIHWTVFTSIQNLVFDSTDGNVILFVSNEHDIIPSGSSSNYILKLSSSDGSLLWATPVNSVPVNGQQGANQSFILNGEFSFIGGGHPLESFVGAGDSPPNGSFNIYTISTQDGQPSIEVWARTDCSGFQASIDSLGAILYYGDFKQKNENEWAVIFVNQAAANAGPLSKIVQDICELVGFQSTDIDVTALTDSVEGYIVANQMTGQDALQQLAIAFQFDPVESDDILKFVKRGGVSVVTIPSADLAIMDSKTNAAVKETRLQEVDLPNQVSLKFIDPNHDYQEATQYSRRPANPYPTMFSKNPRVESFSIVAEPDFMKQLAEKLLFTQWVERISYKTKIPWTYLPYDPTDIITLQLTDSTTNITRTKTMVVGADFTIEMDSVAQDAETYASIATGYNGDGFPQQSLAPPADARLFLLDIPLLRDVDDTGLTYTIIYDTAGLFGGTWPGAALYKSSDNSAYGSNIGDFNGSCSWGTVTNVLGDTDTPFRTDDVNTITVAMVQGGDSLASATYLETLNGANAAAILNQDTGVIEIVQFQTVVQNLDGTYTLSKLFRGMRGTEVYTGGHAIGDTLVLLDSTTLSSIKMALSDLNVTRFFKFVMSTNLIEDTNPILFTDTGRALKDYAPVHQAAATSGSDLSISWVRRTRVGGEMVDSTDTVPLAETTEGYEVDIYDALGTTVLRTLSVNFGPTPAAAPSVLYSAADITADFGSTPTSLIIEVFQIGAIGRGFGKKVTVIVDGEPLP